MCHFSSLTVHAVAQRVCLMYLFIFTLKLTSSALITCAVYVQNVCVLIMFSPWYTTNSNVYRQCQIWSGKSRYFLTFTLSSFIFSICQFPLPSFRERKLCLFLAAIPALPRSALPLCVVVLFEGLFAARFSTKFGPCGIWAKWDTAITKLVWCDEAWKRCCKRCFTFSFLHELLPIFRRKSFFWLSFHPNVCLREKVRQE